MVRAAWCSVTRAPVTPPAPFVAEAAEYAVLAAWLGSAKLLPTIS